MMVGHCLLIVFAIVYISTRIEIKHYFSYETICDYAMKDHHFVQKVCPYTFIKWNASECESTETKERMICRKITQVFYDEEKEIFIEIEDTQIEGVFGMESCKETMVFVGGDDLRKSLGITVFIIPGIVMIIIGGLFALLWAELGIFLVEELSFVLLWSIVIISWSLFPFIKDKSVTERTTQGNHLIH